jgi:hypothetical protein
LYIPKFLDSYLPDSSGAISAGVPRCYWWGGITQAVLGGDGLIWDVAVRILLAKVHCTFKLLVQSDLQIVKAATIESKSIRKAILSY